MTHAKLKIGDKVALKINNSRQGYIANGPRQYGGGFEYFVALAVGSGWYAETDLVIVESQLSPHWENRDRFLRDLLLAKLTTPLSDGLYAFRASRTVFEPYQFRPALKFLQNPDQRILIADEVGLGKTIEACIIYLELRARLDIARVLIVCPARLKAKWRDELHNRFEEDFANLDTSGFRRLLADFRRTNGTIPFRAIVSYETLRQEGLREELLETQLRLDLLIVDEAHHMRNEETSTHQVGAILSDTSDAVIFLTATPLHLGNKDLYNLLRLLSPGDYDDPLVFQQLIHPNIHINRAAHMLAIGRAKDALKELRAVERTLLKDRFIGNPFYQRACKQLEDRDSENDTRELILLQRRVLELNTLSSVFTRTRKREVSHAAVRAAYTVNVTLSPEENAFYHGVLAEVRRELRAQGYSAISFAIVMKERMAASCLAALRQSFEDAQQSETGSKLFAERGHFDPFENDDPDIIRKQRSDLIRLSRRIGDHDSKCTKFVEILSHVLAENQETKVLVFSSFIRTLQYLRKRLADTGFHASMIHGDVKMVDRQLIIDDFQQNPHTRILLSSEVGAEGLDFQFCDVLVNYDLPWNPMQIEQRIGRLDRFGQQHNRIRIYNFYLNDTIETRIFQRLFDRIELFRQSVGDLEAILGEEIRELSRRVLQTELTPEEEESLAEDSARRIIQRKQAEEELEQHRDELLGQDVILNHQVHDIVHSGRVIHPEEVRALVESFLVDVFPQAEFTSDVAEPTWTLTLLPRLAAYLREHQAQHRQRKLACSERFHKAINLHEQIALTFDNDYARQRPRLEFITYNHVLADAAKEYWLAQPNRTHIPALSGARIDGNPSEAGKGFFFIYAIDEQGIRTQRSLHPVIVLDDGRIAHEAALTLLGKLQQCDRQVDVDLEDNQLKMAEQTANRWIAEQRDALRQEAEEHSLALVKGRSAALQQSFEAKIRRLREIRAKVLDDRLHRLYDGQIRNLEAQHEVKLLGLRQGTALSVSYDLVAMGRVQIS